MHLAVFLWGFTGVLGRAITLSALTLVWWRVTITAVTLAFLLTLLRRWAPIVGADRGRTAAVGALMALHWVAFYGSIKESNASVALLCMSTASVFVALLAPLAGQGRFQKAELGLSLLALAGVYLIYRTQLAFGTGILWGLVAAFLAAVFTVLNKPLAGRYPPRTIVFWEMTTGCALLSVILLLAPASLLGNSPFWPVQSLPAAGQGFKEFLKQPNDWLWLLLLAIACTVWAQSLALKALKNISSFTSSLIVNLEPIYGIALAAYFYKEAADFTPVSWAGVGLIFLSVLLQMVLSLSGRKARRQAVTEPLPVPADTGTGIA